MIFSEKTFPEKQYYFLFKIKVIKGNNIFSKIVIELNNISDNLF